ncbi:hypothetical protein M2322_000348 [Rhodoblastus acidophilus]|uniref:hypothetical protein n=1 Tax=Rhodoblastus acidophilus TaxID=1074 RepID=UPI002224043E|nr:hypothetical protein [Rhodoblastus acidophilus]MCW2314828.1 hypothetical protein [Rhodoblastus acidophilus]
MLRRFFFFMFFWTLSVAAGSASDFIVGSKGGLYCASIDDLKALLVEAFVGSSDLIAGCGVLPPLAAIQSATVFRNGPFEGGVGMIANRTDLGVVAFMTVPPDDAQPAPPESGDKVKFDLLAQRGGVVRLSGADLRAETHKWIGKIVETRARCFYADLHRFQCSSGHFRVELTEIEPASARATIERECDTATKASRPVCTMPIRFKYAEFARMDLGGADGRLTLVKAVADVGYAPAQRIAQKRPDARASRRRNEALTAGSAVAKAPALGE